MFLNHETFFDKFREFHEFTKIILKLNKKKLLSEQNVSKLCDLLTAGKIWEFKAQFDEIPEDELSQEILDGLFNGAIEYKTLEDKQQKATKKGKDVKIQILNRRTQEHRRRAVQESKIRRKQELDQEMKTFKEELMTKSGAERVEIIHNLD